MWTKVERVGRKARLRGILSVPGDKSISHRALIFSALCRGTVRISGLSPAADCQSTAQCLRRLGLEVSQPYESERPATSSISQTVQIDSAGLNGLVRPSFTLDAGNSGTTIRILSGLVAGRPFTTHFDGDASLRKRPMKRVLEPLCQMGATVDFQSDSSGQSSKSGCPPFSINGATLVGREFVLPVASAQVQTALLLAGLQADETTKVQTPGGVRDHTERMFKFIGVPYVSTDNGSTAVAKLREPIAPYVISIPGDLSSAAFFMVAAACLPGSEVLLKNVGLNPGRRLVIDTLLLMGAHIEIEDEREVSNEPVGDVRVCGVGRLNGMTISRETIATGIDEIPILALAGSLCNGMFTVRGADELRHKESDRLKAIVENLRGIGAEVIEIEDGFVIEGKPSLAGGSAWKTYHDHRLSMTGMIANLICDQPVNVEETESIRISYPGFREDLQYLLNEHR